MYRGVYSNRRGRTYRSTRNTEDSRDLRLYFPEEMLWFFRQYGIEVRGMESIEPAKPEPIDREEPKEEEEKPKEKPLKVEEIGLNVEANARAHHTDEYEISELHTVDGEVRPAQLITRRGDDFTITVNFDRDFNKEVDKIKVLLTYGDEPKASKETLQTLPVAKGLRNRHWSAAMEDKKNGEVKILIRTPPSCIIGKWKLHIVTQVKSDESAENGKPEVVKHTHSQPVYVIFNPWCKDDTVYMDDSGNREEYVLNDTGRIFSGSYKQISYKPWNFGQFEDFVLDCCLYLLDLANMSPQSRGNAVQISRTISAVVNAPDDFGVLIGNWSGRYTGGTAPTAWVGSAPILQEYWETKEPVSFGQCWVFSGVTTTVCRALGIPCRSVTNFSSAHDCDGSVTIDYHWDSNGQSLPEMNEDSVWNFHVWNEAWMTRPDLPPGFGGWQAIDATPQETSGGIYCAGPSPVVAIKQGLVNLPFDTPFIFAEVNADKVHWVLDGDNTFPKSIQKNQVGRYISTKRPEGQPTRPGDMKRLDITRNYKYKEGTQEERAAVHRANSHSTIPGLYDTGTKDVNFEVQMKDHIMVGSPFDVVLSMQNTSREKRTITADISLYSQYYTGVPKSLIKKGHFNVVLNAVKSDKVVMPITPEDYMTRVVDQVSFQIAVMTRVAETEQIFADQDNFRLRRPDLVLEGPDKVKRYQEFELKISMNNTTPETLTNCEWQIEAPGIQRNKRIKHRDLEPYEKTSITVPLTAKRLGRKQIVASFQSEELMDITGELMVTVVV